MKALGYVSAVVALVVVLAFAVPAVFGQGGDQITLKVGDPAPELSVQKWVKGDVVDMAKGKVYVVEFWATWCPPCRASIPHLTAVQAKYKDRSVVVASISSEDEATVKVFVKKMGDKMVYSVAVDDEGKTSTAWMDAAGARGIPHAFIVDKEGKIAWHGHPMDDEFETQLEKLAPAAAASEAK